MKQSSKRGRKRGRKPETVKVGNVVVKIYRHLAVKGRGKPYLTWQVADYSSGERRLQTFADHAKARRAAERIAGLLDSHETQAATLSSKEAVSFYAAMDLLTPLGVSLQHAVASYAKAFKELGGDDVVEAARFYARHRPDKVNAHRTVAEVVEEFIKAKEARGKSSRYVGDLSARLTRFVNDYAVSIGSVTTADVQRWLDRLDVAPQTAKNFRTVLHTFFHFAETRGYVFKGGNPVAGTERIDTGDGGAIEIYTPGEMLALLTHAPKAYLPLLALGAFAGVRSAEIDRLEWADIDLAGGFIHVGSDKAKTRSRRLVPILPNLALWLAPYAAETGLIWKGTESELREAKAKTLEGTRVKADRKRGIVAQDPVQWKDNALRHSFISYRLADIHNENQVAAEAGNSPGAIFAHYRELVKPEAAKVWFSLAPEMPENVLTISPAARR